jgi:hypothetical protein
MDNVAKISEQLMAADTATVMNRDRRTLLWTTMVRTIRQRCQLQVSQG